MVHIPQFATLSLFCVAAQFASPLVAQENELDRLSRSTDDPFAEMLLEDDKIPVSVTLRALNKITARYLDIEVPIAEKETFGTLEIVPRFCDKRPPEEFPETTAFLQIYDLGLESNTSDENPDLAVTESSEVEAPIADPALEIQTSDDASNLFKIDELGDLSEGEKIFSGWMFASSPALNPLEHPVYDVWVIDCKTVSVDK